MERSAVRLAGFLSKVTTVVLVCKRYSFVEKVYLADKPGYQCETVDFHSRTFSPALLIRARSIVDKHDIKNVIFFGASELKTLFFAFLGFNINLIVWHGTTKSGQKRDYLHRLVYSKVNYHVALSDHLRKNVMMIVPPRDEGSYKVINPSFNIDSINESAATTVHDRLRLVHIGRIADGKGQIDAVKACNGLYSAGIQFQLDLVGPASDDLYHRELCAVIKAAPYANFIIERGYVEDPAIFLAQADLLVFPSYGEGMPNAFIEALHYGIPCLAYANTVFPEYLKMGFNVLLVQDRNVSELSEKLLAIANNIENEKQAAKPNKDLARKYFDVQRELASWKGILV